MMNSQHYQVLVRALPPGEAASPKRASSLYLRISVIGEAQGSSRCSQGLTRVGGSEHPQTGGRGHLSVSSHLGQQGAPSSSPCILVWEFPLEADCARTLGGNGVPLVEQCAPSQALISGGHTLSGTWADLPSRGASAV